MDTFPTDAGASLNRKMVSVEDGEIYEMEEHSDLTSFELTVVSMRIYSPPEQFILWIDK